MKDTTPKLHAQSQYTRCSIYTKHFARLALQHYFIPASEMPD
jgi:hypothetical protein